MTILKVQVVLTNPGCASSDQGLTGLVGCARPAGYEKVVLDLAGSQELDPMRAGDWRHEAEQAGFEWGYTSFDDLTPTAIHNRLFRARPADELIIVEEGVLPAFHLLERLTAQANRRTTDGQNWGAIESRRTPLERPRPLDATTFESGALVGGGGLINGTAFGGLGGFDERMIGLEAATLDLGWRLRASDYHLYRALDTFVYDPRAVDENGPVYSPTEQTERGMGRVGLYFKYGRPNAATALLTELEQAGQTLPGNGGWIGLKPASSKEIAAADWSGLETLDGWYNQADPERDYGNQLDEAALPDPTAKTAEIVSTETWADQVLKLIERAQPTPAYLLDIGARLPQMAQARLTEQAITYKAVQPGEMAEAVETLVEWTEAGENVTALLALSGNPMSEPPAEILKLLAGQASLILVAQNITHQDLTAGLLNGVAPDPFNLVNALDYHQLSTLVGATGWQVESEYDLVRPVSALHEADLFLQKGSLAGDVVRFLAERFNPHAQTEFFVWQLAPRSEQALLPTEPGLADLENEPSQSVASNTTASTDPAQPAISVLIRTQGRRNELLTETLYSVFAQARPGNSYEVVIALQVPHQDDTTTYSVFKTFLAKLPPAITQAVRILTVFGTGNALSLNPLLAESRGQYWFFLDDDDLLVGGYFAALETALVEHRPDAPILQTYALRRDVTIYENADSPNDPPDAPRTYPYATTRLDLYWNKSYQPVYQYFNNELPTCCYLIPAALITQTNLRFDSAYNLYNDWEFLMRATALCKVISLPVYGSCVNMRTNNSQTVGNTELARQWKEFYTQLVAVRERQPLLLEGRAVREIVRSFQQIEELRSRLYQTGQELGTVRTVLGDELEVRRADLTIAREVILAHQSEINRLNETLDYRQQVYQTDLRATESYLRQLEQVQAYAARLEGQLATIYNSLSWKLTFPLRLVLRVIQRLRGH